MVTSVMPSRSGFFASYVQSIRDALRSRKQIAAPGLVRVALPVAVALSVVVVVAILVAPAGDIDWQFREEEGIVTTLSAIFLAMASGFAGMCWLTEGKPGHGLRLWWLLTCLGFFFFACDELMRFHEQLGTFVRHHLFGRPTMFFRNWNDVIVLLYGVIALFVIGYFLPRILRLPLYVELLVVGFVSYATHTAVDIMPHGDGVVGRFMSSIPSSIPEESAKLFASTFFAVAMLNALRILTRTPAAAPVVALAPVSVAPAVVPAPATALDRN
jgi:hypothetical protein